nr:DNA adenine methylase [Burkholderia cepacia]
MANPIIPWIGGKRRLADHLIPRFPDHDCHVEVFTGAAALSVDSTLIVPATVNVYKTGTNDIDQSILPHPKPGTGTSPHFYVGEEFP